MLNKSIFSGIIFFSLLITISLIFSLWLMFHTYSCKNGTMQISLKVWSDFAGNIPLIRSFSLGNNFPPQYPLFSGEPINYHFLFYFMVGLLEKVGLRIDYALNIPSALSFTLLILAIYTLAKTLFKSKLVGLLSVIFFLFNGSLSFLDFFKTHPFSSHLLMDIITNKEFPSFAPYGPGIVSAFWNLNIFTNQRHLALPLALFLLQILWLVKLEQSSKKAKTYQSIIWGGFLGILPYAHSSIFIMEIAVLTLSFLFLPKQRKNIFIVGLVGFVFALPRLLFLSGSTAFTPQIKFGYLIYDQLNLLNFLKYWFLNLGLFLPLLPLGFLFSPTLAKKILIAFFFLFIIGNSIQFSPEIAGNHKFFNVFVIVGNMFVSFALVRLWSKYRLTKFVIPFLFFFLILSGIIDFFPIKNDQFMIISDYSKNPDIAWIINNTPKDAVFLNSSYLYHPASLAGRKIFYGWPYFAWSLGYNTAARTSTSERMLNPQNIKEECDLLKENQISYIATEETKDFKINYNFFEQNVRQLYKNPNSSFIIYSSSDLCRWEL